MKSEEIDDCIELTYSGSAVEIRASIAKPCSLTTQFSYDSLEQEYDPFCRPALTRAATVDVIEVHRERTEDEKRTSAVVIQAKMRANTARQHARSLRDIRDIKKKRKAATIDGQIVGQIAMRQLVLNERKNQAMRVKLEQDIDQLAVNVQHLGKIQNVDKEEHRAVTAIQSMARSKAAKKVKNRLIVKKKMGDALVGLEPMVSFPVDEYAARIGKGKEHVSDANVHIDNISEDVHVTDGENSAVEAEGQEFSSNAKFEIDNILEDEYVAAEENIATRVEGQKLGSDAKVEIDNGKSVGPVASKSLNALQVCMNESTTTETLSKSIKISQYQKSKVELLDPAEVIVPDYLEGKIPKSPRDVTESIDNLMCTNDNKISIEDRDQGDSDMKLCIGTYSSEGDDERRESKVIVDSDELQEQKELEGVSVIQDLFRSTSAKQLRMQKNEQHLITLERAVRASHEKNRVSIVQGEPEKQKVRQDRITYPITSRDLGAKTSRRIERKQRSNNWRLLSASVILFLSLLIPFIYSYHTRGIITEYTVGIGQATPPNQQLNASVGSIKENSKPPFFRSIRRKLSEKNNSTKKPAFFNKISQVLHIAKTKSKREGSCSPCDLACDGDDDMVHACVNQ